MLLPCALIPSLPNWCCVTRIRSKAARLINTTNDTPSSISREKQLYSKVWGPGKKRQHISHRIGQLSFPFSLFFERNFEFYLFIYFFEKRKSAGCTRCHYDRWIETIFSTIFLLLLMWWLLSGVLGRVEDGRVFWGSPDDRSVEITQQQTTPLFAIHSQRVGEWLLLAENALVCTQRAVRHNNNNNNNNGDPSPRLVSDGDHHHYQPAIIIIIIIIAGPAA